MADEVRVGDKFVIEVCEVNGNPRKGNRYWIKGFNTLVFDDNGIGRLEKYKEPPKNTPHSCGYCKYRRCKAYEMPCVMCDKNAFEQRDLFEAANG